MQVELSMAEGVTASMDLSELRQDDMWTPMSNVDAYNIYTSHLLSTWNARLYEFAVILFTASAYPSSLAASSVRGIVVTLASICFSASVGRWVDRSRSRFRTLITTIVTNRTCIVLAGLGWLTIVDGNFGEFGKRTMRTHADDPRSSPEGGVVPFHGFLKHAAFVFVLFIGVAEKLSGLANMLAMERDWIPTLASSPDSTESEPYDLTRLNASMRRIDLTCKLFAPIVISFVITSTVSIRIGVIVTIATSLASWPLEWWCARRVWHRMPQLHCRVIPPEDNVPSGVPILRTDRGYPSSVIETIGSWIQDHMKSFQDFFSTDVWIPSIALSILHLSVLSYSATFITYLLNTGKFSLTTITIARAASSVVEVSSTFVTPWGIRYLSKIRRQMQGMRDDEEEADHLLEGLDALEIKPSVGLERLGLWGLWCQFLSLVPVVHALWLIPRKSGVSALIAFSTPPSPHLSTQISLFFFLCLSRLGLWIYDLTAQQLSQARVSPNKRSSFAGVEMAFVGLFEMGHWIAALTLGANMDDFRWLALGSLGAVGVSVAMYTFWLRRERGHLLHWPHPDWRIARLTLRWSQSYAQSRLRAHRSTSRFGT